MREIPFSDEVQMSPLPNLVQRPGWWQLYKWISDPLGFQDDCRRQYGDIFSIQLSGLGDLVMLGCPKAIGELFSQPTKFDCGRGNGLAEVLVGANSIMMLDGDRHRRERKLLMPSFHGERLHTYAQQICQITTQITSTWQPSNPLVMRTEMQKISLEVILNVVFGLSEGQRYQDLKPLLTDWLNMVDSPLRSSLLFFKGLQKDWGAWSPWGQMSRKQRHVHRLLQEEIDERRTQHHHGEDVLSLMMAARDEQGQGMTDDELRDELVSLLFAGHETTATMLSWAFYQLGQRPDIRTQLTTELQNAGADTSPIEISRLPYLTAVCQEVLRLYPVLPVLFPRLPKAPITIGGYSFDADTILMPSVYLVHFREDIYPNPHQFDPNRFLDRQYSPFEYFPFGGGNRRCLGYALALLEMKLVLATIVSSCTLELLDRKPVPLQRRGFTLSPKGGVQMRMTA